MATLLSLPPDIIHAIFKDVLIAPYICRKVRDIIFVRRPGNFLESRKRAVQLVKFSHPRYHLKPQSRFITYLDTCVRNNDSGIILWLVQKYDLRLDSPESDETFSLYWRCSCIRWLYHMIMMYNRDNMLREMIKNKSELESLKVILDNGAIYNEIKRLYYIRLLFN